MAATMSTTTNFIKQRIEADLASNTYGGKVATRFPPEPSGYLHIGHAKAICLNFSIATEYQGTCNLRFDDTNPNKEEQEFIDAIEADIHWLGLEWDRLAYASDYYEQLHDFAVELIQQGKAYVDSQSAEQIRETRGTLTEPGSNSPDRDRSAEENLELFRRMRAGELDEGSHVLRAKIDMSHSNVLMRDPVIYRILKQAHPRTGDSWCIYPMYDFAHCLSDALEGITHSLCTLEFQVNRPLYEWFLEQLLPAPHPVQLEYSRLNFSHTMTSKRKLRRLVEEGHVAGFDDPRMPTLVGARRRGIPPAAIRKLCEELGISKSDSVIDLTVLEDAVRNELNDTAPRAMCVLDPIKVIIEDYPEDKVETLSAPAHPQQELGTRELPFCRELYIEREDFMEDAPKKFFRLAPDKEVRLRNSYVIKCEKVIKDEQGNIIELRCSHDPNTLGKNPEGRKVKGVIHWVSAKHAVPVTVRLYDRLFKAENPNKAEDWEALLAMLNPESMHTIEGAYAEPGLVNASPEQRFQFERTGYFCADRYEFSRETPVFNRIVSLRDSWNS